MKSNFYLIKHYFNILFLFLINFNRCLFSYYKNYFFIHQPFKYFIFLIYINNVYIFVISSKNKKLELTILEKVKYFGKNFFYIIYYILFYQI